jgi:hypothetical protein
MHLIFAGSVIKISLQGAWKELLPAFRKLFERANDKKSDQ